MTLREKYIESGLLDPKMLATDAKALDLSGSGRYAFATCSPS